MATTPEGKIKAKVSALLRATPQTYYFMPVQNGMGMATLDYIGAHHGLAFAVETKAPGKKPTPRQEITIAKMREAGIRVFIVDGDESLKELKVWLNDSLWGPILRELEDVE